MQDAKEQQPEEKEPPKAPQESSEMERGPSPLLEAGQGLSSSATHVDTTLGVKVQLAEAHSRVYDAFSRAFNRQNTQFEKGEADYRMSVIKEITNTSGDLTGKLGFAY